MLSASRHWLLALLPLSLAVAARARSRSPRAGRRLGASLTRAGCRQRRARLAGRRPPPPSAPAPDRRRVVVSRPGGVPRHWPTASLRAGCEPPRTGARARARPVPLSAGACGPVAPPTPGGRDTQLVPPSHVRLPTPHTGHSGGQCTPGAVTGHRGLPHAGTVQLHVPHTATRPTRARRANCQY